MAPPNATPAAREAVTISAPAPATPVDEELEKRKARAERFGIAFVESPKPKTKSAPAPAPAPAPKAEGTAKATVVSLTFCRQSFDNTLHRTLPSLRHVQSALVLPSPRRQGLHHLSPLPAGRSVALDLWKRLILRNRSAGESAPSASESLWW